MAKASLMARGFGFRKRIFGRCHEPSRLTQNKGSSVWAFPGKSSIRCGLLQAVDQSPRGQGPAFRVTTQRAGQRNPIQLQSRCDRDGYFRSLHGTSETVLESSAAKPVSATAFDGAGSLQMKRWKFRMAMPMLLQIVIRSCLWQVI